MEREAHERLKILHGDLTRLAVDAIVNAANRNLLGGGGVDGAIHRAAGQGLVEECASRYPDGCPTGEARITSGHGLPARHVIHTVGPVWRGGMHGEPELLASCYRSSMDLAAEHGLETLAFPAISCGAFGYPLADAARIALETILEGLSRHPGIREVRMVLFDAKLRALFERTLEELRA